MIQNVDLMLNVLINTNGDTSGLKEMTNLYLRCWIVPKHLNDPLTIMANRVHNASHSSMLQGQFSNNHPGNGLAVTNNPG